jgi:pilus assembly protein FimV
MRFKSVAIGIVLAGAAVGSTALTLGRARGAAWIGQSLEVLVPVQLEAGQTSDAICAQADVFYADSKQDGSRIKINVEPTLQSDTFNLRIASPARIDEPVVTVYLQAGCSHPSTRRFVLLADIPAETLAPAPRTAVEPALTPTLVAPVEANAAPPTKTGTTASVTDAVNQAAKPASDAQTAKTPPVTQSIIKSTKSPPPVREAAAPVKEKAVTNNKAEGGKSRLKLDPLENLTERIQTVETTTSSAPSEDRGKDSERMRQMQGDMKALMDQAAKNEASLLAMRDRLEKAESERVPVLIVYALGALVLLCTGGLFVLWSRRSESNAWRSSMPLAPQHRAPDASPAQAQGVAESPSEQTTLGALQHEPSALDVDLDVNLVDMDADSFGTLVRQENGSVMPVAPAKIHRNFNSDELYDLRDQADFFAKLGKTDQAIEVLEKRIRENSQDAALLYLDLLHIANVHSLKTDFRQFREELQNQYNAHIPEFALFRDEGRDLESYPSLLERIVQVWPTSALIDLIETCVVKDPKEENSDAFDVAAFRDLLMLHGIAYSHQNPEQKSHEHGDIDA